MVSVPRELVKTTLKLFCDLVVEQKILWGYFWGYLQKQNMVNLI